MVFVVVGIPSRFAEWCMNLTGKLVERALGAVEVVNADTVEAVGNAVLRATTPHLVFLSYYPVGRLRTSVAEGTARVVVAIEDPRRAVGDMVARHGSDFLFEATRTVSKSSAALTGWDAVPAALVLHGENCRAAPVAAADTIARHLGLVASDEDLASVVSAVDESGAGLEADDDTEWWDRLDDTAREAVSGAVEPYAAHFAGGQLGPIVWQRELFYINEEPITEAYTVRATRPMDITGRARILIYGPTLFLPGGSWNAAVSVGLSREAAEMSYLVEVFNGTQLAQTRIVPSGGERFIEVILNFSVDDSFEPEKLIQIRIWNERAAFDGRIAIGQVKLTHQGELPIETRAYFETVLGS
jgi:hypothetical protein